MRYKLYMTACCMAMAGLLKAQETDLFKQAEEESRKADSLSTEKVYATFKATRLMNGHTVETIKKGLLDFRVAHRFGFLNEGAENFFGLDNATTRLSLDYGISNRLMVGIGRSTYLKQMDGFVKYRLLEQATGYKPVPVSVTLLASAAIRTLKETDPTQNRTTWEKTSYAWQVLIARKLNDNTSLQLMPTLVHYNMVPLATDKNDRFSLGFGGRQKISKRVSINAEYYWQFNKFAGYYNSLAVGVDIETGGHVFQLHLTNSTGMTERTFIHETTGRWEKGDIHFGFNISRVFNLCKKPKTVQ